MENRKAGNTGCPYCRGELGESRFAAGLACNVLVRACTSRSPDTGHRSFSHEFHVSDTRVYVLLCIFWAVHVVQLVVGALIAQLLGWNIKLVVGN